MKPEFLSSLLVAILCGCDRYPSQLQPAEQVQALIFEHLARELFDFDASHAGDDALRLFLCYGSPRTDPSASVQAYVSRSFRSVRPCSAIVPHEFGPVLERGTGRMGIELRVEPFTIVGDGPLAVGASFYVNGDNAKGFEYHIQRVNGRWTILDRKALWVS